MRGKLWPFPSALLAGVVTAIPVQGQQAKLVGWWKANESARQGAFVVKDGNTIRFKGRPACTVTLNFKSDSHASIQWGDSAKVRFFTYRLVNSKLIELRDSSNSKPTWESFTITQNKLRLAPYLLPKEPQESIAILYTLTFTKQP